MDFQARLEALTHQLQPWSPLWSRSILQGWPESGAAYPEDWLVYARSLDEAGELFVLAWFVASAATVGGGLWSGLETDEAIRAAAYSKREEDRRERLAHDRDSP